MSRWKGIALLSLSAAITVLCAILAPRIETSGDPTAYLPRDRPEVSFWLDLNRRFSTLDLLLVGLEGPLEASKAQEGTPFPNLEKVAEITSALSSLKGVLSVRSITNVETLIEDEAQVVHAEPLVPKVPQDLEGRKELARRLQNDTLSFGSLISRDLSAYVLLVKTEPGVDPRKVAKAVREEVEVRRGPLKAYYFGGPFIANEVTSRIYGRLYWLAPLFCLLLFGTLLIFRLSLSRSLLILGSTGLALLWWLGAISASGLTLTMTDINGLLIMVAFSALLFARWASALEAREEESFSLAPVTALAIVLFLLDMVLPSFLGPLPYLVKLGRLLALGIVGAVATGLLFLVPIFRLLVTPQKRGLLPPPKLPPTFLWGSLVLLVFLSAFGLARLRFLTSLSDLFGERCEVGASLGFFERHFGGADFIQVSAKGDFRDPAVASRLLRLEDLLEGVEGISQVRGIGQVLGFVAKKFSGLHRIPKDPQALSTLWFFLEGNKDIEALVSKGRDEAMITLRVGKDVAVSPLVEKVKEVIELSSKADGEVNITRLLSLARAYSVDLPKGRIEAVVSALQKGEKLPDPDALALLRKELTGPEAPFSPTTKDLDVLEEALKVPDLDVPSLAKVVSDLEGFVSAQGDSSLAYQIADTLIVRLRALDVQVKARKALDGLVGGIGEKCPEAFKVRSEGIFADVLEPPPPAPLVSFAVTGYPVLSSILDKDLYWALLRTTGVLVLAVVVGLWIGTQRLSVRLLIEVIIASALALSIAGLTGLHVDSGSATLYLLAPLASVLTSGAYKRLAHAPNARRYAIALACASATLLLTGVLPVIRIGLALSFVMLSCAFVPLFFEFFEASILQRRSARE